MRLCVGTSKGIVILDPARGSVPLMVLADPSSVWCMARDCSDPNVLYAGATNNMGMGTARGKGALARSVDAGRTWTDVTPAAVRDEDVWAVAAAPDVPNEVYIGTSHARLLRSSDRGRSFQELTAFARVPGRDKWTFPPPPHIPHVRSITFGPHDSKTIYVGVEEGGIFRTRNYGLSFEPLNEGLYCDVHNVAVDARDPSRLYATTGRGFYLSQNAGATWQQVTVGLNRTYTVPLLVSEPSDAIYVAAAGGPPPTWFIGHSGADARLFRSDDHGRSFTGLTVEGGPMRAMVMRFAPDPDDSGGFIGVMTDGSVIRSCSGGEAVAAIAQNLPPAYDLVALP